MKLNLATPPTIPAPEQVHERVIKFSRYFNFPHPFEKWEIEFDLERTAFMKFAKGKISSLSNLFPLVLDHTPGNDFLAGVILDNPQLHEPLRQSAGVDQIILPGTIWQASFPKENLFLPSLRWIGNSFDGKENRPINQWYHELINLRGCPIQEFAVPIFK